MRYAHLSPAHKAHAVAKLGAALTHAATVEDPAAAAANLDRNWNVLSGRQTTAKKKYVEARRRTGTPARISRFHTFVEPRSPPHH